jgi:hypothetical protein
VKLPAGSGRHASSDVVVVPVRARGKVPVAGGGTPMGLNPTCALSGERVKAGWVEARLSKDATPITRLPTPEAPAANKPAWPLLPTEATTTTPLRTSSLAALAVGYSGHSKGAPMLRLTTCMPSSRASSMASMISSGLVSPVQPNTR